MMYLEWKTNRFGFNCRYIKLGRKSIFYFVILHAKLKHAKQKKIKKLIKEDDLSNP